MLPALVLTTAIIAITTEFWRPLETMKKEWIKY